MTPELEILSEKQRDEMMKKCCKKLHKILSSYGDFTLMVTFPDPDKIGPTHRITYTWSTLSDLAMIYTVIQSVAKQTKNALIKPANEKD